MSDSHEYIDISSDSSSESDSNRMPPPPYLPPCRPPRRGSRTKEEDRRFKNDINAKYLPWHRDYKSPPSQASPAQPAQPQPAQPTTLPVPPPQQPQSNPAYEYPALRSSVIEYMPKAFLKSLSTHLAKLQSEVSWEDHYDKKSPPSEPSCETPTSAAILPTQAALTEGSSRPPKPSGVVVGLACKRVWEEASVAMGKKRTMPDAQELIHALSNATQVKERRETKAKGKRPME